MRSITERIKQDALRLPPEEREDIARTLVDSLDGDPGVDPEWYAEILRRLNEVRSGTAEMIPGEVVMAELEEFLREEVPVPPKGAR